MSDAHVCVPGGARYEQPRHTTRRRVCTVVLFPLSHLDLITVIYATADEADAYMFYRCLGRPER